MAPESGTALIWKLFSLYMPSSHIHMAGMGFGGASRLTVSPSTCTWLVGCAIGRLCWELVTAFVEISALTILVGRLVDGS